MKYLLIFIFIFTSLVHADTKKKVLFLHGKPSHGPGAHEHRAGEILMAKRLNESFRVRDQRQRFSKAKETHGA